MLASLQINPAAGQAVTTLGGRGERDDDLFLYARLATPWGVARDAAGNLYVADTANHRIRKVDTSGRVSTIAGVGTPGYSGIGGPAINAHLSAPTRLAVDSSGNIYFTEQGRNWIKKISAAGTLTRFAGSGASLASGDGGPAINAGMGVPQQIQVDGQGSLYFADQSNRRVRKIDPQGNISTIAGNGAFNSTGDGGPATQAAIAMPTGLALDAASNVYVSDLAYGRVRRIDTQGVITSVAGNGTTLSNGDGGPATSAALGYTGDLGIDGQGRILVADGTGYVIRAFVPGGTISTVAGVAGAPVGENTSGPATSIPVSFPHSMVPMPDGGFLFASTAAHSIRRVTAAGQVESISGLPVPQGVLEGAPANESKGVPVDSIAADAAGNVYLVDTAAHLIRRISPDGMLSRFAGTGQPGFAGDGGPALQAQFNSPKGITFDAAGNLYVADTNNYRIRRISPSGVITTVAGNGSVAGFVVNAPLPGDGGPATSAALNSPKDVAVDAAGNLYIADGNLRARKVDAAGIITTFAGGTFGFSGDGGPATAAGIGGLTSIATDASGNVYLMDAANYRVRRVNAGGIISTVAGNGINGESIAGEPAVNTSIGYGAQIRTDSQGRILLTDFTSKGIKRIVPGGTLTYATPAAYTQAVLGLPNGDMMYGGGGLIQRYWQGIPGGPKRRLTLVSDGSTTLTSVPAGLNCAVGQTLCTADFEAGAVVRLLAANNSSTFALAGGFFCVTEGNSRGSCDVRMDREVWMISTANFSNLATVGYATAGSGSGSVVECSGFCGGEYSSQIGETITLRVAPNAGSEFAGWTGVQCMEGNQSPACTVMLGLNYNFIANFNLVVTANSALSDLNDDGKSDVVWRNGSTGQNWYWAMNGTTITAQGPITTLPVDWQIQSTAVDFDGDGMSDILLRNMTTGQPWIWFMNGNAIIGGGALPTLSDLNWTIAGTGDLNGDGKGDVIWRNTSTGANWWWALNGTSIIAQGAITTLPPEWQFQSTLSDFNGDGKADILLRNMTTGQPWIWFMNGNTISSSGPLPTLSDLNWTIAGTGDLNGDGKHDVVWRNTATGANWYWALNGTTITNQGPITTLPTDWQIQSTSADFDGDGKADILLRNMTTGQPWIWFMNGNSITGGGALPTLSDMNWQIRIRK